MIEFKKAAIDSPDVDRLDRLNIAAFPEDERLDMKKQLTLQKYGEFEVWTICSDGEFAGFMTFRRHSELAYLCYFAIEEKLRSRGIGGEALRMAAEIYRGRQRVVEVELPDPNGPDYELRVRRKNFYLRNGFCETGWGVTYFGVLFEICGGSEDFDVEIFKKMMLSIDAPGFHPKFFRIGEKVK